MLGGASRVALPQDRARGVRRHRRAGRGRAARLGELALPEVSRHPCELRALHGQATRRFAPAFPAATNPVLRRPPRPEGRVWIENAEAVATVDLANACYGLMLRLLGYAYAARRGRREVPGRGSCDRPDAGRHAPRRARRAAAGRALEPALQRGRVVHHAARRRCAAPGRRGAAPVHRALRAARAGRRRRCAAGGEARAGAAAAAAGAALPARRRAASSSPRPLRRPRRAARAARGQRHRAAGAGGERRRGERSRARSSTSSTRHGAASTRASASPGRRRCSSPTCRGPWIHPDAMPVERLVEVAHACPSGAIRYRRRDGQPQEARRR